MRALTTLFLAFAAATLLVSCASLDMTNNRQDGPAFVLEDYFLGETRAYGVFEDGSGKVTRTFSVVTRGTKTADGFVLDERFLWNDGEKQSRTWTFTRTATGFEGRAGDVNGIATVTQGGNAIRIQYLLNLPYNGSTLKVRFDDWSHLVADGVAINRADVTKFGVKVGRVTLSFVKPDLAAPTAEALRNDFKN